MSSPATSGTANSGSTALWRTLGRHQLGAVAATALDFVVMIASVEFLRAPPAIAAAMGAVAGAVANFFLGRRWVFRARSGALVQQAERYAATSAASAGWNALGEYVLHDVKHVEYVVARVVVSLAVGLLWNFPVQRRFVFKPEKALGAG